VKYLRSLWAASFLIGVMMGSGPAALCQSRGAEAPGDTPLHQAARTGDLASLRSLLDSGADPNQRDANGERPLLVAVAAGQLDAARMLIAAGAKPNLPSSSGRTPLIEASLGGRIEFVRLLLSAGADPNIGERGAGTPLEAAEREGHTEIAALLRRSGARAAGRSVGDKVCVRPWRGDGYCGIVDAIDKNRYRLRVTEIVGCADGCPAMADCSAGKPVGGPEGLKAGDIIAAAGSCLTHTGVPK